MNQEMNCIWAVAAEDWNCFLNSLTMVKLTRDVATRSIVSTAAIVMMQMHPLSYSYFTSTSTIQHRIHPAPWSGIIRTDICKFLFVFKFIGKKYLKICDIIYLWKWRQQVAMARRAYDLTRWTDAVPRCHGVTTSYENWRIWSGETRSDAAGGYTWEMSRAHMWLISVTMNKYIFQIPIFTYNLYS